MTHLQRLLHAYLCIDKKEPAWVEFLHIFHEQPQLQKLLRSSTIMSPSYHKKKTNVPLFEDGGKALFTAHEWEKWHSTLPSLQDAWPSLTIMKQQWALDDACTRMLHEIGSLLEKNKEQRTELVTLQDNLLKAHTENSEDAFPTIIDTSMQLMILQGPSPHIPVQSIFYHGPLTESLATHAISSKQKGIQCPFLSISIPQRSFTKRKPYGRLFSLAIAKDLLEHKTNPVIWLSRHWSFRSLINNLSMINSEEDSSQSAPHKNISYQETYWKKRAQWLWFYQKLSLEALQRVILDVNQIKPRPLIIIDGTSSLSCSKSEATDRLMDILSLTESTFIFITSEDDTNNRLSFTEDSEEIIAKESVDNDKLIKLTMHNATINKKISHHFSINHSKKYIHITKNEI